jgi:rubredoxin
MPLIECRDHSYAPMVVICRHLYDGESDSWCPIKSDDPEVDHDWLCPECFEHVAYIDVDDLVAVCMHCARKHPERFRRQSDEAHVASTRAI